MVRTDKKISHVEKIFESTELYQAERSDHFHRARRERESERAFIRPSAVLLGPTRMKNAFIIQMFNRNAYFTDTNIESVRKDRSSYLYLCFFYTVRSKTKY